MATDVIEKVRRLIALTASENVHEAKTAALQACRIIVEHKLQVVAGVEAPKRNPFADGVRDVQEQRAKRPVYTWADINIEFTEVPYPPKQPEPEVPRQKFFCDGCKTECPQTWSRGKQAFCERCREDFDRVIKEEAERRVRERLAEDLGARPFADFTHGTFSNEFSTPQWDVYTTLLEEIGRFNPSIGRRDSRKSLTDEEIQEKRREMGLPPLTAEQLKNFHR